MRGDVLFRQHDPVSELVVLLIGHVTARIDTPHGRIIQVDTWAAPCALDKVALLTGGRHTFTAYASVDCSWRSLPSAEFTRLIDNVPSVRHHVLRILAGQADAARQALADATTLPVTARLARLLLHKASETGQTHLAQSQEELAQALGVTRVTVNRALHRLQDDQLVRVSRGRITLLAPEVLSAQTSELV